jgi:hypothetical protein
MAVLGNNNIQATAFDAHAYIYGQIFQATQSGTVTDINVYLSADVDMTLGIYASSSSTPSTLINATAGGTTGVAGTGWKTKSLSASLVSGNFYALTVTYLTAAITAFYDNIASNPRYFQTPYTYVSGTLPGTFPSGTADNTAVLSIYVNYTPSGAAGGNGSLTLMGIGKDFSFPVTLFGGLEALRKRKNKVRHWEKNGHIWRLAA